MALLRTHHTRIRMHPKLTFWSIYPLSLLFVFHLFLVAYINSSYMERFVSAEGVGALYTIGSALAVLGFLFFSHALKAVGNVRLTLILALIDFASLVILGATDQRATAIVAFTTFITVNPLLFLNIDIFSEALIGTNESKTGSRRGFTLALMSLAAVLSPLLMGYLVDGTDNLQIVYFASAGVFVFFILFLLFKFRDFVDPEYDLFQIRKSLRNMWLESDVRNVMFAHLLLQMFFAFTVIYIPLYLATEMGFKWDQISYMVAFALVAYLIFEWPIGIIADKFIGEKEIMALGFVVLSVSVSWITFLDTVALIPWMVLLFITRTGAAMVESTTEGYFFKHTDGSDADTIGFFRLLRPLSNIFGALLGSVALLYLPFNYIFLVLGLILASGIYFTHKLIDTK